MHTYTYLPPRRGGTLFQGLLLALSTTAFLWQTWESARGPLSAQLSIHGPWMLFAALCSLALAYTFRALQGAYYLLSRDGLILHWGLREVTLSTYDILWVAPLESLSAAPPGPLLRLPGAWLGRAWRSDPNLGRVEYLGSRGSPALAVATSGGTFIITPQDVQGFLETFAALNELGSVAPLTSRSISPGEWLVQGWNAAPTRWLWGGALALLLLIWLAAFRGMGRVERIALGFTASRLPRTPVPAGSLILLPLLGTFFTAVDWVSGQFLYRRDRMLAYLFWSAAALTNLGLLGALLLLLRGA